MDLSNGYGEQLPQLFETAKPEISRKTSKFNLRKSLAWDSAFFENPGFLDAEELSTMIDGADKGEKHLLTGIDEDINKSTESISTLASENLTLESLESELIEDIRASIQKSSKASSIYTSNRRAALKETDKLVNRCFLDAEELSTMIDGADKGEKHLLSGIDEDINRSTESVSIEDN